MANVVLTQVAGIDVTPTTFLGTFLANSPRAFSNAAGTSLTFTSGFFDTDQSVTMAGPDLDILVGSGGVTGIASGTIRTLTNIYHGDAVVTITGLRVDAPTLFAEVRDRDATALLNIIYAAGDIFRGSAGADSIFGFGGKDKIFAGAGKDQVDGGTDRDTISGGAGRDRLTGGSGDDWFQFDTRPASGNVDTITDFTAADDGLRFDRSDFAGIGARGAVNEDIFVAGNTAQESGDRFLYVMNSGRLYFDRNGDGNGGKVLVAELGANTVLTADDIFAF